MSDQILNYNDLYSYVKEIFVKAGTTEEDGSFLSKSLVETTMRGVGSHGVMRVPIYIKRMLNNSAKANPDTKTVLSNRVIEIMDGDNGNGIIVGKRAMERAITIAKENGVGIVGVRNSNHFGACALYTQMAVDEGMIGVSMTNVKPLIVAPGAKRPVAGNNPFSVGIPTFQEYPFIVDMACSVVAAGKFTLAIKKGEKIPKDWGTDKEGNPTDDPKKAFEGYLLPMGGFKGLSLAYIVDVLSGIITGASFSHNVLSMYDFPDKPSRTGHMMIAVNLEGIIDKAAIAKDFDEYHNMLQNTPMLNESDRLYFPGEREYLLLENAKTKGVLIPEKIYSELIEIGEGLGVTSKL